MAIIANQIAWELHNNETEKKCLEEIVRFQKFLNILISHYLAGEDMEISNEKLTEWNEIIMLQKKELKRLEELRERPME